MMKCKKCNTDPTEIKRDEVEELIGLDLCSLSLPHHPSLDNDESVKDSKYPRDVANTSKHNQDAASITPCTSLTNRVSFRPQNAQKSKLNEPSFLGQ